MRASVSLLRQSANPWRRQILSSSDLLLAYLHHLECSPLNISRWHPPRPSPLTHRRHRRPLATRLGLAAYLGLSLSTHPTRKAASRVRRAYTRKQTAVTDMGGPLSQTLPARIEALQKSLSAFEGARARGTISFKCSRMALRLRRKRSCKALPLKMIQVRQVIQWRTAPSRTAPSRTAPMDILRKSALALSILNGCPLLRPPPATLGELPGGYQALSAD